MAEADTENGPGVKRPALLPMMHWLPSYRSQWLKQDVTAGVTLAAFAIPVSLAYATMAGLPPHHGIYCYLMGCLAYSLLGTSRQLAIGPTAAISLLVGTTIAGMTDPDPARLAGIAALTALAVAVISVVAWLLRLSSLMNFVSETILLGFKAGAALSIALTQLPKLFGIPGGGENFFERLWNLAAQIPDTNLFVLSFGLSALALLIAGEKLLPGQPVALAVVVLSIIVVSLGSLSEHGLNVVGDLPAGLPVISWPSLRIRDVEGVVPLAFACFLLSYIESISSARMLAAQHGYEVNPRQELLALGAANCAVAFGQGFPVAGGLSQSAVNDKAGAQTPLALLVASATLGLCLLCLTAQLRNLPMVVLASVVLVAVRGLVDIKGLKRLYSVSRPEFYVALFALFAVLFLGILKGVLLASIASMVTVISAVARPQVAFLGRIPGTRRYSDIERHPDNEQLPGVLMFRIEASLLYFNAEHVREIVGHRISITPELRLLVGDLSNSPIVDVAGADMLSKLHRELAGRGIRLRLVGAHARVRDQLRAQGIEEQVGQLRDLLSIDQAISEFTQESQNASLATGISAPS